MNRYCYILKSLCISESGMPTSTWYDTETYKAQPEIDIPEILPIVESTETENTSTYNAGVGTSENKGT